MMSTRVESRGDYFVWSGFQGYLRQLVACRSYESTCIMDTSSRFMTKFGTK